jgi:hypothetical protein
MTKWDEITGKNFIFCLNWLSYELMKAELDEKEYKKQMNKIKNKQ